jgi:predicted  nucleic acid-binding Zn-ribbon protein
MKKLLLLLGLSTLLLSSCGYKRRISDLETASKKNAADIASVADRVTVLESQMASSQSQMAVLEAALSSQGLNLQSQINDINASLSDLAANDADQQAQLDALADRVQALEDSTSILQGQVATIEGDITGINTAIENLQDQINATNALIANYVNLGTNAYNQIQSQINGLSSASTSLNTTMSSLQSSVNSALVSIATLQGYNNIVSIKDPCGDGAGFDEVFLKLSNGKYLASFSENSSGKNTRFSLLADGSFVTTDGTNCQFTVSGSGTVISNEHN